MSERNIETEDTKVVTGKSGAASSHRALSYNLISPYTIRRLAERLSKGAVKYGSVQWRQGINDAEYVADRYNHMMEHLLLFAAEGNTKDDNLGAVLWGINCLLEVERLAPEALIHVVGITDKFGETAKTFHEEEMRNRAGKA